MATKKPEAPADEPAEYSPRDQAAIAFNEAIDALRTARDELARIKERRVAVTAEHAAAEEDRRKHAVAAVLGDDDAKQQLAGLTLSRDDAARLLEDLSTAETVAAATLANATERHEASRRTYLRADFDELKAEEEAALQVFSAALEGALPQLAAVRAVQAKLGEHPHMPVGVRHEGDAALRRVAPEDIYKALRYVPSDQPHGLRGGW